MLRLRPRRARPQAPPPAVARVHGLGAPDAQVEKKAEAEEAASLAADRSLRRPPPDRPWRRAPPLLLLTLARALSLPLTRIPAPDAWLPGN